MAVFINEESWLTIGSITYNKTKCTSLSRGEDSVVVRVSLEDMGYISLSFKEHGADNNKETYEEFFDFIKDIFKPTIGGGGGGAIDVSSLSKEVTLASVKTTVESISNKIDKNSSNSDTFEDLEIISEVTYPINTIKYLEFFVLEGSMMFKIDNNTPLEYKENGIVSRIIDNNDGIKHSLTLTPSANSKIRVFKKNK